MKQLAYLSMWGYVFLTHYSFRDAAESSPSLGQANLLVLTLAYKCCLGDQEHNTEEHEIIQMGIKMVIFPYNCHL